MHYLLSLIGIIIHSIIPTSNIAEPSNIVSSQWVAVGLNSNTVRNIVAFDNRLFAATTEGVYVTEMNDKYVWKRINTGLGNLSVFTLLPVGNTLFAGTKDGVYTLASGAETWIAKRKGIPENNRVYTLLKHQQILYGGSAAGIFTSSDNGENWTLQKNGFSGEPYVYALTTHENTVYAGTQETGIKKTTDNGNSWQDISTGLALPVTVGTFKVVSGRLLAGTDGAAGLYFLDQATSQWKPDNAGLTTPRVFAIVPTPIGKLYACSANCVYSKEPKGERWEKITIEGLPPGINFNNISIVNNQLYVCTDKGIYWLKN